VAAAEPAVGGIVTIKENVNEPMDPCSWKGLPSADDFYTINNISNVNEGATNAGWGTGMQGNMIGFSAGLGGGTVNGLSVGGGNLHSPSYNASNFLN